MQNSCSFGELAEKLRTAGSESDAAEAHGLLCGCIAAGGKTNPDIWLEHLLGTGNTLSAAAQDCRDMLEGLQKDILAQLNDESFGFSVLLPQDNTPLSVRTRALGEWCEGFLYGLALGGIRDEGANSETVEEVMKDFYDISHAGFTTEAPNEGDEVAFTEIVEYLRMSVLLLYQELQAVPASTRLQ